MEAHNLEKLTEKIYQEGIEKSKSEAERIIHDAKEEAGRIVEKAKKEAQTIMENVRNKSDLEKKNVESDLRLKGRQAINDLKREIRDLISQKVLKEDIRNISRNEEFLKDMIIKLFDAWDTQKGYELQLPASLAGELSDHFSSTVREEIPDLTITFNDHIDGGFRIARKEDSFELSFTDEDFIAFFQPYLNQTTNRILFDS